MQYHNTNSGQILHVFSTFKRAKAHWKARKKLTYTARVADFQTADREQKTFLKDIIRRSFLADVITSLGRRPDPLLGHASTRSENPLPLFFFFTVQNVLRALSLSYICHEAANQGSLKPKIRIVRLLMNNRKSDSHVPGLSAVLYNSDSCSWRSSDNGVSTPEMSRCLQRKCRCCRYYNGNNGQRQLRTTAAQRHGNPKQRHAVVMPLRGI